MADNLPGLTLSTTRALVNEAGRSGVVSLLVRHAREGWYPLLDLSQMLWRKPLAGFPLPRE